MAREAERIRGPLNPNINDECGLLVEGFDQPNAVMMPYNPPYHGGLIEGVGFTGSEASWVLEDNIPVHQLAGLFAAKITRRYRVYDRLLK